MTEFQKDCRWFGCVAVLSAPILACYGHWFITHPPTVAPPIDFVQVLLLPVGVPPVLPFVNCINCFTVGSHFVVMENNSFRGVGEELLNYHWSNWDTAGAGPQEP